MSEGRHSRCKRCSTSTRKRSQARGTSSVLLAASTHLHILTQQLIQLSVSLFVFTKVKATADFRQVKAQLSGHSYTTTKTQICYRYRFSHFFMGIA